MQTLDEVLIAVHVLAAVTWVGGGITLQAFGRRILASGDGGRMAGFMKDVDFVGQRLYLTASLLLLGSGIWLVSRDVFELQPWVWFGIAVFTYSFIAGAFFAGPESGRIAKLIEAEGPDAPDVRRRIRRLLNVSTVEALLLILVVIDMAVKPGA